MAENYTGSFHMIKARAKDAWLAVQEKAGGTNVGDIKTQTKEKIDTLKEKAIDSLNHGNDGDYSHVYRCVLISRNTTAETLKI